MVLTYYVISQRNNQQPQGTTRTAQTSTSCSPPSTHNTLYTVAMEKLLQVTANTIEHESDSRGYCVQRLRVKIAYNNKR